MEARAKVWLLCRRWSHDRGIHVVRKQKEDKEKRPRGSRCKGKRSKNGWENATAISALMLTNILQQPHSKLHASLDLISSTAQLFLSMRRIVSREKTAT